MPLFARLCAHSIFKDVWKIASLAFGGTVTRGTVFGAFFAPAVNHILFCRAGTPFVEHEVVSTDIAGLTVVAF